MEQEGSLPHLRVPATWPILSQLSTLHNTTSDFLQYNLNIIHISTPGSPKASLIPSGFPTKTLYTPLLFPMSVTWPSHLNFYLVLKTKLRTQLVGVFIINLGTKFQTRNSNALLVTFIKGTEKFFFHIQPKYCTEKCCIFFQATLLHKMVELIINGAGD